MGVSQGARRLNELMLDDLDLEKKTNSLKLKFRPEPCMTLNEVLLST